MTLKTCVSFLFTRDAGICDYLFSYNHLLFSHIHMAWLVGMMAIFSLYIYFSCAAAAAEGEEDDDDDDEDDDDVPSTSSSSGLMASTRERERE